MIKAVSRIISLQVLVTCVIASLMALLQSAREGYSALLGGAIGFVPGTVYALRILRAGEGRRKGS